MENRLRTYNIVGAVVIFFALPLLIYTLGESPSRSLLKETLSVVTIVSFFVMLLQFYLSRANSTTLRGVHKMGKVVKLHKELGYIFAAIIFIHPLFIVLPRLFEAGVDPVDALVRTLTTFQTKGVILGLIGYILLLIVVISSFFRDKLPMKYRSWRIFHGVLSTIFIAVASFHVAILGRHSDIYMVGLIAVLAVIGVSLLLNIYLFKTNK